MFYINIVGYSKGYKKVVYLGREVIDIVCSLVLKLKEMFEVRL